MRTIVSIACLPLPLGATPPGKEKLGIDSVNIQGTTVMRCHSIKLDGFRLLFTLIEEIRLSFKFWIKEYCVLTADSSIGIPLEGFLKKIPKIQCCFLEANEAQVKLIFLMKHTATRAKQLAQDRSASS